MVDLDISRALAVCPAIDIGNPSEFRQPEPHHRLKMNIKGDGSFLMGPGAIAYADIQCSGSDNLITLAADGRMINSKIRIKGDRCRVLIGPRAKLKSVTIELVWDDCLVVIGAGTTWESGAFICDRGQAIIVGNDCMFSNNIMVRTNDGHGIWDNSSGKRVNMPGDVFIDHHVWIGNGARVSKGTRVGMGSVIGQCAVASGTLQPECVYAGIPARKKRENIHWTRDPSVDEMPVEYRLFEQSAADAQDVMHSRDRTSVYKSILSGFSSIKKIFIASVKA